MHVCVMYMCEFMYGCMGVSLSGNTPPNPPTSTKWAQPANKYAGLRSVFSRAFRVCSWGNSRRYLPLLGHNRLRPSGSLNSRARPRPIYGILLNLPTLPVQADRSVSPVEHRYSTCQPKLTLPHMECTKSTNNTRTYTKIKIHFSQQQMDVGIAKLFATRSIITRRNRPREGSLGSCLI